MNKKKAYTIILAVAIFIGLAYYYFAHHTVAVLDPKGPIALKERNLLLLTVGIMLIVVIPVFIITFYIVYKYREGHNGKYKPDFDHSVILESVWWLIPTVLIAILAVITWRATFELDPYRTIASSQQGISIEAIALDWKWLFVYPNQHVASVNYLVIPVNHPITFYITADAPMNSFWIPQLSGQMYAMAGMSSQINMMATSPGNYYGSSANISGNGFAGMHFDTHAVNVADFKSWVSTVSRSKNQLSMSGYNQLANPSYNNPISYYSHPAPNLYQNIISKFLVPAGQANSMYSGMMMGM